MHFMIRKGKIIIISGPSGSGKTTLYKKLLADETIKRKIIKTISATTRPPRPGERHGRDYFFLSPKEFLARKKAGYFLESQKVFDNYYGTPEKNVRRLLGKGKNVLLCIDVKGAKVVCRKFPEAVRIFINVPSLTVLRKRLEARGSESKKIIQLRLKTARKEVKEIKNYTHIVVNVQLERAHQILKNIILSELTPLA